jgi:hypothetical protein
MRRKGKQKKKKIVKDKEMLAFIDVSIDLFPYNQYRDCVNKKNVALF